MTTTSPTSPPPPETVITRFLFLSDTHTILPFPFNDTAHAYRYPLPQADVLLHSGDITMTGRLPEYACMLAFLATAPAELKLVIAGNHDITLDAEYYRRDCRPRHGGVDEVDEAKKMWTGEAAVAAGIVYLEEGVRTFRLKNGAEFTIYSSPYQPEFCNWAFNYPHDQDRFNPPSSSQPSQFPPAVNPVPSFPAVDILMTHGPPYRILDLTTRSANVGCPHLLRAASRARPRIHCFGHIHEAWGAKLARWTEPREGEQGLEGGEWKMEALVAVATDMNLMLERRAVYLNLSERGDRGLEWGRETLFVNASVVNKQYKALNAPWLVDLDLPLVGAGQGERGGQKVEEQ